MRQSSDYSTVLNEAFDSHQYPLLVLEDLFTRLNRTTSFAKLKLSDTYLQMEVDDSKELQ